MTEPTEDKMLDRIRALLTKAERTEFPAEAEALTAKAAELIAKYGIDAALLQAEQNKTEKPGDRIITLQAPYVQDKAYLLQTVAEALRCKTVLRTSRSTGCKETHMFGFEADLDRVEILYTSLLVQAAFALGVADVPYHVTGASAVAAWRRSWYVGFTKAVGKRLRDAEAAAKARAEADRPGGPAEQGPSVALVLVGRDAAVEAAAKAAYPKAKPTSRRLSGAGFKQGADAGQRANLGGTGVNGAGARAGIAGRAR